MSDTIDYYDEVNVEDFGDIDDDYDYFNKLSDKQLKDTVSQLVSNKHFYKRNSYTNLVESILMHNTFSEKQRKVLVLHLCDYSKGE